MKRTMTALVLSTFGALLLPQTTRAEVVFLSYTSFQTRLDELPTGVGFFDGASGGLIRAGIKSQLETIYSAFPLVTFTETMPGAGDFETITFGGTDASLFGLADQIDFRNLNRNDVARVFTANFGFSVSGADDAGKTAAMLRTELTTALTGTAAHEYGHNLGLQHHDAYGNPLITPANYANTMGIQNRHILATGATGIDEAGREVARTFNCLELAKLEYAAGLTASPAAAIAEQGAAHGTSGTAQALALTALPISGVNAAAVLGTIATTGQADFYSFTGTVGDLFTANILSEAMGGTGQRYPDFMHSILTLFAPDGTTVVASNDDTFYSGNLFNGGTNRGNDSFLLHISLAQTGTYFLRVTAEGTNPNGSYELFLDTRAIPEPSSVVLAMAGIAGLGCLSRRWRRERGLKNAA